MAVGDGIFDKVGNDPVQSGALLSLLPSLLIHAAVLLAIWLGLFSEERVTPAATFITLAPAAAPAPAPEFEPLPLPETGMALPQPATPAADPVLDFTPPTLPAPERFPFDPQATRAPAPAPDPQAVALEKAKEKPKEARKKPDKPKQPLAPPVPARRTVPAATASPPASSAAATPARAAPSAATSLAAGPSAAPSDAPLRVTNPSLVGCPLEYPERARRRNQQGTVHLRYRIGTDGKASDITVTESSGHRLLDEAAQRIIADCKFQPQLRGDRPVPVLAEQEMPFRLN